MDKLCELLERGFISQEEFDEQAKELGGTPETGGGGDLPRECNCITSTCQYCGATIKECEVEDHEIVCLMKNRKCVHCGVEMGRTELLTHMIECAKDHAPEWYSSKISECKCGQKVFDLLAKDHQIFCYVHRKCPVCSEVMEARDVSNHMNTCEMYTISCHGCLEEIRKIDFPYHSVSDS